MKSIQSFQSRIRPIIQGFKFDCIFKPDRIIIKASSVKESIPSYIGQVKADQFDNFQLVKSLIEEEKIVIVNRSWYNLKIQIGSKIIELVFKPISQIFQFRDKYQKSQTQLNTKMQIQRREFDEYKNIVSDLKKTIDELKSKPQISLDTLKQMNKDNMQAKGFTSQLKHKQCWQFKIKKNPQGIYLGLCLKSIMQEKSFTCQNIDWQKIGQGIYLIGSGGWCYSHSSKGFNGKPKSFEFNIGDVILMEYDPFVGRLRCLKKKSLQLFDIPLPIPPQGDAYHPCVAMWNNQQDRLGSIELKYPVK